VMAKCSLSSFWLSASPSASSFVTQEALILSWFRASYFWQPFLSFYLTPVKTFYIIYLAHLLDPLYLPIASTYPTNESRITSCSSAFFAFRGLAPVSSSSVYCCHHTKESNNTPMCGLPASALASSGSIWHTSNTPA
jgi:hypothetical protein